MAIKYVGSLVVLFFAFSCNRSEILTKSEKEWLNKHPNLVVGLSPNAPPYQFINEKGEEVGIFIDFLTIIENQLDYKFKKVYQSDFSKLLTSTKEGSVDVLLEIQKTRERQLYLNFTPVLISHKHVIVVRKTWDNFNSISDLRDKKIAVVNQFAVNEYLTKNYPDYLLLPLFDDVTCLRAVSTGQADAFICQQAVSTYYIVNEGISNLKIAGEIDYANELTIASRKSQDTLNAILSKTVNNISKTEKQNIYSKWLSYEIKPFYLEARFWIMIATIFLIALFLIGLFSWILQRKVNQKTNELKIAKDKAEENEFLIQKQLKELQSSEEEIRATNEELVSTSHSLQETIVELVKAKEHAEESDRLKSAFLANMSHEIRTPMNGILGFSELLKEPNLAGEEKQEYIEIIGKGGRRMLNIINDIVDISKIEAGLMDVELTGSDINKQIDYIYTFFKPEAETKGLKFSIKNTFPLKEMIMITDHEKLYAILTNLVKNAIKYTEKGSIEFGYNVVETHGRASLPISNRASLPISGRASLQFYVKDTGIGIPTGRQQAIFERFIQADYGNKRAFEGAGLGLAITKSYVEMLGGKIWVESMEGIGSTFYFNLPYKTEQEEKRDIKEGVVIEGTGNQIIQEGLRLKILIAEDDEISTVFISKIVEKFAREILKTCAGIEAIEACRKNPDIDLVLMDIQLPELNGYEATRQIRQFNNNVVIIAQTAFALSGDREKALEAGCDEYVPKPVNKDELVRLIQKHFKK